MAKCDLCGGSCRGTELVQLLNQYQTADVVDICPACEKWANRQKSDMLGEIPQRMRDAIAAKKGSPQQEPARPWWRRLMR